MERDLRVRVVRDVDERPVDGDARRRSASRRGRVGQPETVGLDREQRDVVAAAVGDQQPGSVVAQDDGAL